MNGRCCYVLASGGACNEKTKYRFLRDDDGNRYKKHDPFCPKHRAFLDEKVRVICDSRDGSQDYFITRDEATSREDLAWSITNKCYTEEVPPCTQ